MPAVNNRKVLTLDILSDIETTIHVSKITGKPHVWRNSVIQDGDVMKMDSRLFFQDKDRLVPTNRGIRFTFDDLTTMREKAKEILKAGGYPYINLSDLLSHVKRHNVEYSQKLDDGYTLNITESAKGIEIRKALIHRDTGIEFPSIRGFTLSDEDLDELSSIEETKGSVIEEAIGFIRERSKGVYRVASKE